ncbi:hypothetical protein [Nakamurella sp.]|uniref:hypothetical protein n=1 Tax=Nakamurella sp. TaxID=1869182 RepID=UPI0037840D87
MTAPWGPGLDAEVAYRQEQVRSQFRRRNRRWFRRTAPAASPPAAVPTAAPAPAAVPLQRAGVDATDGAPASTLPTTARAGSPAARRAA